MFLPYQPVALVAGGAVFLGAAVGAWLWRRRVTDRRQALEASARRILGDYGASAPEDIRDRLEGYEGLWANVQNAARIEHRAERDLETAKAQRKAAEEPVLNGLDFEHGDSEAARASRAVAQGQRDMDALRERRAVAEGRARAMGDPLVLRSEQEKGQARRQELLAQESALALALEALGEADAALREKFTPMVAEKAAAIFAAKTRRAGDAVGREMDYLSQGTKDQLYLALRLAVCELVLPQEQACPVILDDALAAFDETRMERALDMLKELSKTRQVLLFSCHDRERAYFKDDPDVTKIEVGHV